MNVETTKISPTKTPEASPTSSKISRLTLAVSMLALSVVSGCNKPKQGGSNHLKPTLHLSCSSARVNSNEIRANVTHVSNIKLTQENLGTFCTSYTEDMDTVGNQIPVTVSCKKKKGNNGTISSKIHGVTIEVSQGGAICEITNK